MEKTIRITRQIVIDQILKHISLNNNKETKVLEPSAGKGDLVNGILKVYPKIDIECVELNKELREILLKNGYKVVGTDFLTFNTEKKYDAIIACPTYKNNIDIEHIMHMYDLLKNDGVLISLTHPLWTVKNSENQRKFRKWLEDKNYYMVMLHDYSFIENHETQPSMIIKIIKGQ